LNIQRISIVLGFEETKMADLKTAITTVRESTTAIFRVRKTGPTEAQFSWGSGFCIVGDRYVVTAFHVLNGGNPRDPQDKHYAFTVPRNGGPYFVFPVVDYPLERPDIDIAVLEIGPCANGAGHVPALAISFAPQVDGTDVVTVGFPAPEVHGLNVDNQGNFVAGNFFLKTHANEGIIAAHYPLGPTSLPAYEFNVGWHHGESGGPVAKFEDQPAVFTLMQHYRNIQGPNGTLDGPRRGLSLSLVEQELRGMGATVV
jgi:hypothetical protein